MVAPRRRHRAEGVPGRRGRGRLVASLAVAGSVLLGYGALRASDPDDRLFHPRFRLRILDEASGAPIVGVEVAATRRSARGEEAVRVWPRERRRPLGGSTALFDVWVGVSDAAGEVELEGDAATAGCDVRVGPLRIDDLVLLSIPKLPASTSRPPDGAILDFGPARDGTVYDVARVHVADRAPDGIRLRRTPYGVVTVRSGAAQGPPTKGVKIVRGLCTGATASGVVLGETDATGTFRALLPTQGTLAVHAAWDWFPRADCGATNSGGLSREQPALAFVVPQRPRARLVGLDPLLPDPWRVWVRQAGAPGAPPVHETYGPGETAVELPLVTHDGPHEVFVDRGDLGGRGVVTGVRAGADVEPRLRRGEALRVRVRGLSGAGSVVLASTAWPSCAYPGSRTPTGEHVFRSIPEGSWELRIDTTGDGASPRRAVPVRVTSSSGTFELDVATLTPP